MTSAENSSSMSEFWSHLTIHLTNLDHSFLAGLVIMTVFESPNMSYAMVNGELLVFRVVYFPRKLPEFLPWGLHSRGSAISTREHQWICSQVSSVGGESSVGERCEKPWVKILSIARRLGIYWYQIQIDILLKYLISKSRYTRFCTKAFSQATFKQSGWWKLGWSKHTARYFECLASGLPADGGQAWPWAVSQRS